jgi:hypothetical protein
MSEQIKKTKNWFNQYIDESEIRTDTKRFFPIRNKVGKGVVIVGILLLVIWVAIIIVAPEETIPQTREYYNTQEPFRTLSTWFMLGGIVVLILGVGSWVSSWTHLIKKEEKKEDSTEEKDES